MDSVLHLLKGAIIYFFTKVLAGTILICGLVALSFVITKGYSHQAFSDRVVWVGIGMNVVAGIIVMGQMATGKEFGVNSMVRSVGEAKRFLEHHLEIRAKIEKRYDAALLVWLVGLACIGAGALIDTFLT